MTMVTALRIEPAEEDSTYFATADDQQVTLRVMDDHTVAQVYRGEHVPAHHDEQIVFPTAHLHDILSALYELMIKREHDARQTRQPELPVAQALQAAAWRFPYGRYFVTLPTDCPCE